MPDLTARRLREQDGFTLIEMLVTLVIGGVVLMALVTTFVTTINATARVDDRVDTEQRVRVAIDRITTLLGTQVCLDDATAPIAAGSTATSVLFYADVATRANNASSAHLERLTFDPTARTVTQTRFTGTTTSSTVASTNVVATNVTGPADGTAVFKYFVYTMGATPDADGTPVDPGTGLTAAVAGNVVHVRVSLRAYPRRTGSTTDPRTTALSGDVYSPTLDPSQPEEGPLCGL